jgi:hypothetical protein
MEEPLNLPALGIDLFHSRTNPEVVLRGCVGLVGGLLKPSAMSDMPAARDAFRK